MAGASAAPATMSVVTLIIAHRGASAAAPENTLEAFERAVAMGADAIELDVRRTADDQLVVHHDPRLADGRVVRETPAADLPAVVPRLDVALDACRDLVVNIEIKNDPREPDFDPADWVAMRVAAELAGRGGGARWLISSFRIETVQRVASVLTTARTAWLVVDVDHTAIGRAAAIGCAAIHPRVDRLDRPTLRRAHGAGLAVNVWTCDDPARIGELIGWGVDGICTNAPDVALAVRSSVRG